MTTRLSSYATPTLLESSMEVSAFPPAVRPLYRPVHLAGPAFGHESGLPRFSRRQFPDRPVHSVMVSWTPGSKTSASRS